MDITKLTPFNALSTPADLWVLPDIQSSKWTQEVDYYINFQITKAQARVKKNIDPALEKIMANESENFSVKEAQGPLMIVPQTNLPTKSILYLKDTKDWLKKSYEIWEQLKRPTVKLFLPKGVTADQIHSLWKDAEGLSFIEE